MATTSPNNLSSSSSTESLSIKDLNRQPKWYVVALSIVGLIGLLVLSLGISGMFGSNHTFGFAASIGVGSLALGISIIGIIWYHATNSRSLPQKSQEEAPFTTSLGTMCLSSAAYSNPEQLQRDLITSSLLLYRTCDERVRIHPATPMKQKSGNFTIYISCDPQHMEKAIPIVIETLYKPTTPICSLQFMSHSLLSKSHRIGKEFVLSFSQEAESNFDEVGRIQKILNELHQAFLKANILPEKGIVLILESSEAIKNLEPGKQEEDKNDLQLKLFLHQIPGSPYFFYRSNAFVIVKNDQKIDERSLKGIRYFYVFQVEAAINQDPSYAYNPGALPDPYYAIKIDSSNL